MAWVSTETDFDPDALGLSVVGIAADFGRQGAGEHHHSMGQLLFTRFGCVSDVTDRAFWLDCFRGCLRQVAILHLANHVTDKLLRITKHLSKVYTLHQIGRGIGSVLSI